MIENLTKEQKERLDEIVIYLKDKIKSRKFFGQAYFLMNDYFYTASIFVSIVSPFAIAVLIYFPESNNTFNLFSLTVSSIGLFLAIIRTALRFSDRSRFNIKKKNELENMLNKILFGTISKEDLVNTLNDININESDDPQPD
jgi:hypothetical protein